MNLSVRLRAAPNLAYPPRPSKIRPRVKISDFRKFYPKTLHKVPPPAILDKPQPQLPLRPQVPNIHIKPAPTISKQIFVPSKQPIGQQLTEIRKRALERARAIRIDIPKDRPRPTPITRQFHSSLVTPYSKITSLRNIGVGRVLVIIAAGPSANEVDFGKIKNHPFIDFMCINKPFPPVWPAKFWAFCDHTQYRRNEEEWNRYNGIIINSTNVRARKGNQIVLNSKPGKGFSKDITGGYHIGRSSTYANMQVAYYMNYEKIYIFGIDMTKVGDRMHFYGTNPDVSNEVRQQRFAAEAQHYLWAAQNLPKDIKDRFVFCSSYNTWEFTKYFEKLDHKTAVEEVLKFADRLLEIKNTV